MGRKTGIKLKITVVLVIGIFFFYNVCPSFSKEENIQDLKKQIKALQEKVERLESEQNGKAANQDNSWGFFKRKPLRWDPFEEITRMQQEMDRMFKNSFSWGGNLSKGMFRSNVFYDDAFGLKEEKDRYVVEIEMSDMDKSNVEIQVDGKLLTVKSERSKASSQEEKDRYFSSKSFGTFMRSIVLPGDADTAKMKTEHKNGKMVISLPKKII